MDEIPIENLLSIAQRLGEHQVGKSAEGLVAPTATLICNILSTILVANRRRDPRAPSLKHMLRHAIGEDRVTLHVYNARALESTDITALRALSTRVLGIRFQFTSPQNDDPLGHSHIIFDVLHSAAERVPTMPVYTEPVRRRHRTMEINWTNSVVAQPDRAVVLAVIDDVYNMHQLMPVGMSVSIEGLEDTDHTGSASKKRKAGSEPADDGETSTEHSKAALIGYCLHFVNIPSFNDNFLTHMAQKHATRWLGATVLFPRTRKSGALIIPAQLMVSVGCEHALVQASKPRATLGAKRLCKKIYAGTDE